MSDENENQEVEVYQAPAQGLMLAQDLPDLEAMTPSEPIAMQYLKFQQGVAIRANFAGLTKIQSKKNLKEGEEYRELDAVVLQTKEGLFLNSGASLVNQLRNVAHGTPVQVTFTGQETTSSGNNVNKFDVRLLSLWKPKDETVAKWNELVSKAKVAGLNMNFDISASHSAAELTDRVTAINAALKQKQAKK